MKVPLLFFLVLVLASSDASAGWLPAPFNIIDEKVFDGDWAISDKHGTPIKNIERTDNSWAWVDIVGFENESVINGTRYVDGTPRSFAIVKYDSGYCVPNNHVFVSYDAELKTIDTEWDHKNDTTEAIMHTKFVHKYWFCEPPACLLCEPVCYWIFVTECLAISSIVDSPEIFNNSINDYEITITSYNNSVTPYTLIYIPPRKNIIKQSVHYKNDTSSWYNLTGLVKTNDRGTEHVRFVNETGYIIDVNETITRRAGFFVINEAPLNWSLLSISVFTPYIEKTDLVCNATIYNSKPSDFVAWKPIVVVVGIMASFLIGIFIALKR